MRGPVSVLFVDPFSKAAPTLRTALAHMPTLKMIVEAELDQDDPCSTVALVFVQEPDIARTLSLIGSLKGRRPTLRVIVAFQALNGCALRRFLEAGADAFVMHGAAPEDFHAALTVLAHGDTPIEKSTRSEAAAKELRAGMTRREVQILRLLSIGCSNKEIAHRLNLSVRTVETHRFNLRRKTQAGGRHDLVSLARHLAIDADAPEVTRAA